MTSAKTGAEAIPYGARGRPDLQFDYQRDVEGLCQPRVTCRTLGQDGDYERAITTVIPTIHQATPKLRPTGDREDPACPLPDAMPRRPERAWGVYLPLHHRFLGAAAGSDHGILSPVCPESILDLNSSTLRTSLICSLISNQPSAAPWAQQLGIKMAVHYPSAVVASLAGVAPVHRRASRMSGKTDGNVPACFSAATIPALANAILCRTPRLQAPRTSAATRSLHPSRLRHALQKGNRSQSR
jgi:hypothetical protein